MIQWEKNNHVWGRETSGSTLSTEFLPWAPAKLYEMQLKDAFHKGWQSSSRVTPASEAVVITQKGSFKGDKGEKAKSALPEAIQFLIKKKYLNIQTFKW